MHLAEAQELGVLKSGDHAKDTRLVRIAHVILEPDQIVAVGALILLPELHNGIRPAASARIR